ncbi:MAG: hypothetical protein U0840_05495 [Gemmataceae bacterium]
MAGTLDLNLQRGLGVYYLLVALMNIGFGLYYQRAAIPRRQGLATFWYAVAGLFAFHALGYGVFQAGWVIPEHIRRTVDRFADPISYTLLSVGVFVVVLVWRRFFTNPHVAWGILMLSLLVGGWSFTDPNFRAIVAKEDNVPITMLIYSVAFFTWLGLYRSVQNDDRIARGEPVLEKLDDEKVLVWPDLVYTELICMVIATLVLVVWSILLKAPLEQPATSAKAPNPSKAPWYFLGLQEMLVYFDPWMAGVVMPTLIMIGLIALPYIDFNREGSGYYTFVQRKFAITVYLFGFLVLWVVLIVLGTFLRGPNWNFFAPFEYWDPHKVLPLNNINISDLFWLRLMGTSPSTVTFPGYRDSQFLNVVWRELPGLLLVLAYLVVLPPLLAATVFRKFFVKMGLLRYFIMINLLLFMAALPIKMILRWSPLNLKYIVAMPEYFFNI